MRKFYLLLVMAALFIGAYAQPITNRGRDFWVGFPLSQTPTSTDMRIYMGALSQGDSVRVAIAEGTPRQWIRTYWVPANSTVASEEIPRLGQYDARLLTEGLHTAKSIHITSRQHPIVAYAHCYSGANSGATMLLPSHIYASENYVFTTSQHYTSDSYSSFHIVASHDSTWVEINPSKPTRGGWVRNGGSRPNGSYLVKMNKGDVYQVLGAIISGSDGYDLTGSIVTAVTNDNGQRYPVAVFSGSTRTSISCTPNVWGPGDLIIQQVFPYRLWGTRYVTAPFYVDGTGNNAGNYTSLNTIYRVLVKDTTTAVYRNGALLLPQTMKSGNYYEFTSSQPEYITASQPVLVAQYMSSSGQCGNPGSLGDPEMVYLTPLSNAIPQTAFYRNNVEAITQNFLQLVIPLAGMSSLRIDGTLISAIPASQKIVYGHPTLPGYMVVIRKWPAAKAQVYVQSNYAFTGITYGVGSVESYAYNLGAQFDSLNVESIKYNTIRGAFFLDVNNNQVKDSTESFYSQATLYTAKAGGDTLATISSTGSFLVYTDTGSYISSGRAHSPFYTITPVSHTSVFNSYYNSDTVYFAVAPQPGISDVQVKLYSLNGVRPGFQHSMKIVCRNNGAVITNVTLRLAKSSKLVYDTASQTPLSVAQDTITWNIDSLIPGKDRQITVKFSVLPPPTTNIGDTIISVATVSTVVTDVVPANDTARLIGRATNAYDPNDKAETHGGQMKLKEVKDGGFLHYTIRFQNTGNDTAFKVVVRDTLDAALDPGSLAMIDASHHYQLNIVDGRCTWTFDNIMLPDSNRNKALSQGYISFITRPKQSVAEGDVITNSASIYFDHNLPILTNTEVTRITGEVLPVILLSFTASKSTDHNMLQWRTASESEFSHFELERSSNGREFRKIGVAPGGQNEYAYNDYSFERKTNYYRLKMVDRDGSHSYSIVRMLNNAEGSGITFYPNPVTDKLNIRIDSKQKMDVKIQITSLSGSLVLSKHLQLIGGLNNTSIETGGWAKGTYRVQVIMPGDEVLNASFIKQ